MSNPNQLPSEEKRMATQLASLAEAPTSVTPEQCIICTENLWKTYDMGSEQQVHALRGISVRIQPNEYVAIMGPSGSGKSTLMNLIGCLDTPSQGNYWLNGQVDSGSAWRLLAPWSTVRPSFWLTSPPATWTRRPAWKLWRSSIVCMIRAIPSSWSPTSTISPSTPIASSTSETGRSSATRKPQERSTCLLYTSPSPRDGL